PSGSPFGGFLSTPANVKLCESPSRAGGLPTINYFPSYPLFLILQPLLLSQQFFQPLDNFPGLCDNLFSHCLKLFTSHRTHEPVPFFGFCQKLRVFESPIPSFPQDLDALRRHSWSRNHRPAEVTWQQNYRR